MLCPDSLSARPRGASYGEGWCSCAFLIVQEGISIFLAECSEKGSRSRLGRRQPSDRGTAWQLENAERAFVMRDL